MKALSCTYTFISKFNINNVTSSCKKLQIFLHKNVMLQKTCPPFVSAYRCMTVTSTYEVNILSKNVGKQFPETENEYAHEVMEKLPNYSNSLMKYPLQTDSYPLKCEGTEHLDGLHKFIKITLDNLSVGSNLENPKFTDVVQKVCSSLPQLSDDEIQRILHYLCMWPTTSSSAALNFKDLWNSLDRECVKRFKRWDVSQKLLIADYWFHLRLSRITQYNSELISDLVQNIDSLLSHQLVQLLFYINLQRKIPAFFVPNLETKLESVINCVTLEEVGVICLGFFKTENKISNLNLIKIIIKEFMNNVENVNTITVAAILKMLRKSLNFSLIDLYILTMHKCISCIDNFDIPTSVHLALLSAECNVYHPLLLNCVTEKLACKMSDARLKDCAKLLLSSSMFNHFHEKFYELFFSELKKEERQNEFYSLPVHVVQSALFYAYMGHYNYDLLAKIFEKKFFVPTCLNFHEAQTAFNELDYCVEIECQDYTGPKMNVSERKILENRRGNIPSKSEKQNMQARLLTNVYECLVEILGSNENILIRHILPHVYTPDIIVRLLKSEDKSLSDLYRGFPSDLILKPPSNEVWVSFVIGGLFSFAYKSNHVTGVTAMKLRQLKKIGYHVVFIPYFNVSRNALRRKQFFKEQMNALEEMYHKQ